MDIHDIIKTAYETDMNWEEFFSALFTYTNNKIISEEEYDDIIAKIGGSLMVLSTINAIKISFRRFIEEYNGRRLR